MACNRLSASALKVNIFMRDIVDHSKFIELDAGLSSAAGVAHHRGGTNIMASSRTFSSFHCDVRLQRRGSTSGASVAALPTISVGRGCLRHDSSSAVVPIHRREQPAKPCGEAYHKRAAAATRPVSLSLTPPLRAAEAAASRSRPLIRYHRWLA